MMNYELFEPKREGQSKKIFLINMGKELNPYFSEMIQNGIGKYLNQGKRIAILVNKKGFSSGVLCQKCGHVPKCKNCSVSISYHKLPGGETLGMCHICKTQYPQPRKCPECSSDQIKEYGLGLQKVAEYIQENYNTKPLQIDSDKANSPNKISKLSNEFNATQVFLGTSLLNIPPRDVKIDLVIFLQADLGLNIPDYTANENNFHFLYDTFRAYKDATFLVQTFNPDHYSIRKACKMSKEEFWQEEELFRKEHDYPPYGDLCVLLYKNEIEERLFKQVDTMYKELLYLQQKYQLDTELEIYSTPPLIYKVYGKYRYHIILKGPQVRNFMDIIYTKLNLQKRGFKVDRQAQSIV